MKPKPTHGLVAALVMALLAAAYCHHDHESLNASRAKILAGELQPLATLLRENQALIRTLQSDPFTEKTAGILESYLAKIRRDSVAKHADMKQRLDTLAENNAAIVTLIKAHSPHANTLAFSVEADKFRNASAWRDRWNSVMEIFMAGGNYAASEVPSPTGFPGAVRVETAMWDP
jgi:hypothetical protein